jgi:hypothetical protein
VLLSITKRNNNTGEYICYYATYFDKTLSIKDTSYETQQRTEYRWGVNEFRISPSGKAYSFGRGIYILENDRWRKMSEPREWLHDGIIVSDDRMVFSGANGSIYHYNGVDWQNIGPLRNDDIRLWGVWADENEIYAVGTVTAGYAMKGVLIHGK